MRLLIFFNRKSILGPSIFLSNAHDGSDDNVEGVNDVFW